VLVQFTLKNVLSFREETILDMTAISAYKEHACNLIDIGTKERFLRVASIYGANASGKSNLNVGMRLFQNIVKESLNNVDEGLETAISKYYVPFLFEENSDNSEFQIVMIIGGFEYRYGFEYNDERIEMEWLYRKNLVTNRTITILERSKDVIEFGAFSRKECDAYKDQIPSETLVLSVFNKLRLKTEVFKIVYAGIMSTLVVSADSMQDARYLEKFLPDVIEQDKEGLIAFLTAIDSGIQDIYCDDSDKVIRFITMHRGKNGKDYPLSLYDESEGTIKSIVLFIQSRIVIAYGASLFIDELNIKLHPLLLKFVVDLFYDNDSSAQLIYTTHDTTLMDKKFFRRDQIWFVQKDESGYSALSALSDFKVRSDASFEKDYLAGVYGGIPLLKEFGMKEGE
jgi:AAA15 family ATPase/GTPase